MILQSAWTSDRIWLNKITVTLGGEKERINSRSSSIPKAVKAVSRFIQNQKLGTVQQCNSNTKPLLHTKRKLPGPFLAGIRELDNLQYLVNSCIVQAEQCGSDFEIFVCSQIFVKRGHLNQSTDMLQIIRLPRVAVKLDASRWGANAGEHFLRSWICQPHSAPADHN